MPRPMLLRLDISYPGYAIRGTDHGDKLDHELFRLECVPLRERLGRKREPRLLSKLPRGRMKDAGVQ